MNIWYFIITTLNPLGLFQLHEVGDTTITVLKYDSKTQIPYSRTQSCLITITLLHKHSD